MSGLALVLIGTATAAHQVEGANVHSDWWHWELVPGSPCAEPSGAACAHYEHYREDIALLAQAGLQAYRFSIEWARIMPAAGKLDHAELQHYSDVIEACLELGVEPIVTLHHFTNPLWMLEQGGWAHPDVLGHWEQYVRAVAPLLAGRVRTVCTLNEINMIPAETYLWQGFPPFAPPDETAAQLATEHVLAAHDLATRIVRELAPDARCGMTLALAEVVVVDGGAEAASQLLSLVVDPYVERARTDAFLGVQVYCRIYVGPQGRQDPPHGVETTQMGWEYSPQALERVVRDMWERTGGVTLLVTENGIATADDERRIDYLQVALEGVDRARADGIDVGAYLHWSLLDNFEWRLGYRPTFGLVAVDRNTQQRSPKPSLTWLGARAIERSKDAGHRA